MMRGFGFRILWLMVLPTSILGATRPVPAQGTPLLPSMVQVSNDPVVITTQLRLAANLGKDVLNALSTIEDAEPLDNIVGSARNVYVLLRAARAGMERQRQWRKTPSPMLEHAYKEMTDAWNLARIPVDRSHDGISRGQYLNEAIPSLREAIRIVERVLLVYR